MKQSFRFCQFNSKPDFVFSVVQKTGAARARAGRRGGSSSKTKNRTKIRRTEFMTHLFLKNRQYFFENPESSLFCTNFIKPSRCILHRDW